MSAVLAASASGGGSGRKARPAAGSDEEGDGDGDGDGDDYDDEDAVPFSLPGDEDKKSRMDRSPPLCGLCLDGGKLLCCDGPCLRSFHIQCLGVTKKQVPSAAHSIATAFHIPVHTILAALQTITTAFHVPAHTTWSVSCTDTRRRCRSSVSCVVSSPLVSCTCCLPGIPDARWHAVCTCGIMMFASMFVGPPAAIFCSVACLGR